MRDSLTGAGIINLRLMNTNELTIGLDLGDRKHTVCVLSAAGEILAETEVTKGV